MQKAARLLERATLSVRQGVLLFTCHRVLLLTACCLYVVASLIVIRYSSSRRFSRTRPARVPPGPYTFGGVDENAPMTPSTSSAWLGRRAPLTVINKRVFFDQAIPKQTPPPLQINPAEI